MWPQGQAELPRLWKVLCRSWRGVLACGSGGATGRVGCVAEVRDGRVSWAGVGGPHPSAADVGGCSPRNARSLQTAHLDTGTRVGACVLT